MRKQHEVLEIINRIKHDKKLICIYGMGKIGTGYGKAILESLDLYPDFYCDNDSGKWNEEQHGDEVYCISPKRLSELSNVACFVLLGQKYEEEAINLLSGLGIDTIISWDELCSLDIVIDKFYKKKPEHNFKERELEYKLYNNNELEYNVANYGRKKYAIYTCITGGYDDVVEPECILEDADYFLISDTEPKGLKVLNWINSYDIIPAFIKDNIRRARFCKIIGYRIFKDYEYSIYIDGNVKIKENIDDYYKYVGKSGLATHRNAYNNCLYSEGIKVIAAKRACEDEVIGQIQCYKAEGMPRNWGEFQTAILVRENNNLVLKKLMESWWKEVYTKSWRDQLSITYCMWKNNMNISDVGILGPNMRGNKDFEWVKSH